MKNVKKLFVILSLIGCASLLGCTSSQKVETNIHQPNQVEFFSAEFNEEEYVWEQFIYTDKPVKDNK